jgi:hypothetical protein
VPRAGEALEQAEIERSKRKPTESLDSYDYFLPGVASVYQWTRDDISKALKLFYQAIELDPNFATAPMAWQRGATSGAMRMDGRPPDTRKL